MTNHEAYSYLDSGSDDSFSKWYRTQKQRVINIETKIQNGIRVQRPEDERLSKVSEKLKFLKEEKEQKELCEQRKHEKAIDLIEEHLNLLDELTPTATKIKDTFDMLEQQYGSLDKFFNSKDVELVAAR